MARAVAKVLPEVATVERMKDKRGGKLYVDYGQNGEGRTIVAPYTIRARDGAVVSTPIRWDEVTEQLDPTRFTIRTVLARIEKHGDLYAGVLTGKQRLPGGAEITGPSAGPRAPCGRPPAGRCRPRGEAWSCSWRRDRGRPGCRSGTRPGSPASPGSRRSSAGWRR